MCGCDGGVVVAVDDVCSASMMASGWDGEGVCGCKYMVVWCCGEEGV